MKVGIVHLTYLYAKRFTLHFQSLSQNLVCDKHFLTGKPHHRCHICVHIVGERHAFLVFHAPFAWIETNYLNQVSMMIIRVFLFLYMLICAKLGLG